MSARESEHAILSPGRRADEPARRGSWDPRPVAAASPPCTTYPAIAVSIAAARSQVLRAARAAGASPMALADIELAVSEATTNAILHAHTSTGARAGAFAVSTGTEGALFSVWVTDDGQARAPRAPSSGLGLGLELMDRFCERLLIGVLEDGRTQVEMDFDLRGAARS